MSQKIERSYSSSSLEMLLAGQTISAHFIEHLIKLQGLVKKWNEPYALDLQARIQDALHNLSGADHKKTLREASALLKAVEDPAREAASSLKDVIEAFLPKECKEIKKRLGYSKFWVKGKHKTQPGLIGQLIAIKTEMNEKTRTKLTDAGIDPEIIDTVIAYAAEMEQANLIHEKQKTDSREFSHEAQAVYEGIYQEIMTISKIAGKKFKSDPLMRDRFIYNKVLKRIRIQRKQDENGEDQTGDSPENNSPTGF